MGFRAVKRKVANYNLDMIILVGYRVKSVNATLFRRWATTKLKEYLLFVFNRLPKAENYHFGVCGTHLYFLAHLYSCYSYNT